MIRAFLIASAALVLSACYSAPEPCDMGGYIDADCLAASKNRASYGYYRSAPSVIYVESQPRVIPAPNPWAPIQRVAPARVPYYGSLPSQ